MRGPGRCELLGITRDENGADNAIPGPTVQLPVIAPGKAVFEVLRWQGPVPNGGLQVTCEPGLRS